MKNMSGTKGHESVSESELALSSDGSFANESVRTNDSLK